MHVASEFQDADAVADRQFDRAGDGRLRLVEDGGGTEIGVHVVQNRIAGSNEQGLPSYRGLDARTIDAALLVDFNRLEWRRRGRAICEADDHVADPSIPNEHL